ncbi:MerR family transcriptional regulator [Clavibacter michiganensis]|uniref:MerR family transcriptional regulator n=1 Tax=Clavibacter michiganensis TaxID=28447 RepID=UPI000CE7F638|nr:MerR family transcriptional regulator [Clavibacter michiganensis]PPF91268.1 MerR family transcriptional regulator [Clavibacter michiganensis]PPF99310.1 MerR family transcriptional regulator [Clavibacter michiganensis]
MIISEISAKTGVSPRSIRYYEQQGLITPARATNGYRNYDEGAVDSVIFIGLMYRVGFSVEEVRRALPCVIGRGDLLDMDAVLASVESKRVSIAARIDGLSQTHERLMEFLRRR